MKALLSLAVIILMIPILLLSSFVAIIIAITGIIGLVLYLYIRFNLLGRKQPMKNTENFTAKRQYKDQDIIISPDGKISHYDKK